MTRQIYEKIGLINIPTQSRKARKAEICSALIFASWRLSVKEMVYKTKEEKFRASRKARKG